MEAKLRKSSKALIKQDAIMAEKLASGAITQTGYNAFRVQATTELRKQVNSLAEILNKADKAGVDVVNQELPKQYAEAINQTFYEMETRYGVAVRLDIVSPDAVSRSVRGTYFRKLDMLKNTAYNRRRITSAITGGMLRGSSVADVAKTLLPLVNGNRRSAVLNARTWMNGVRNGGRFDATERLDRAGVKMKKVWLSAGDDRVRDSHRLLDGEERDIDEEFSNGGQYPCDPALDGEEYYNCRCTMLTFPDGFEPDTSERNMDLGGQSYEQWKAGRQRK